MKEAGRISQWKSLPDLNFPCSPFVIPGSQCPFHLLFKAGEM